MLLTRKRLKPEKFHYIDASWEQRNCHSEKQRIYCRSTQMSCVIEHIQCCLPFCGMFSMFTSSSFYRDSFMSLTFIQSYHRALSTVSLSLSCSTWHCNKYLHDLVPANGKLGNASLDLYIPLVTMLHTVYAFDFTITP